MRKFVLSLSISLAALLLAACELTNPVFTITCTEFVLDADYGRMTVDNTGWGDERVIIRAYDGYGNQILSANHEFPTGSDRSIIHGSNSFSPAPQANPIRVEFFSPAGGGLAQDTIWYTTTGNCADLPSVTKNTGDNSESPEAPGPVFTDGRLNNWDTAAPFAIYREGEDLHFYWADGGFLALVVTQAQMTSGEEFPAENTLIAANDELGLGFYRLTDGRFQAQARVSNGKLYVIIFDEIYTGAYESYEVEQ